MKMKLKTIALIILFALLSVAAVIQPGGMSASRVRAQDVVSPSFAQQVVALANQERAKAGLPPLKANALLEQAAQAHSQAMAEEGFFAHQDPNTGTEPGDRARAAGYAWNRVGENIAQGADSPTTVVAGWMNSPEHRANILDPDFREIGIGYVFEADDLVPCGDLPCRHYWTQLFGTQPDVYPLVINSEAFSTTIPVVNLYIYGQDWAQEMRFRNDESDFSPWEPFKPDKIWTLTTQPGVRTVTVEIRSEARVSRASDSIYLVAPGVPAAQVLPSATAEALLAPTPSPTPTPLPVGVPGPVPDAVAISRVMDPPGLSPGQVAQIVLRLDGQNLPECKGVPGKPVDVVLVFDISSSAGAGPGSNWEQTQRFTHQLLDQLSQPLYRQLAGPAEQSRLALVTSQTTVTGTLPFLLLNLTRGYGAARAAVDAILIGGDTDIAAGVTLAANTLASDQAGHARSIVLMLHDNVPITPDAINTVAQVSAMGIPVYLVSNSLNIPPEKQITQELAVRLVDQDKVFLSPKPEDLRRLFIAASEGDPSGAARNFRLTDVWDPLGLAELFDVAGPGGRVEANRVIWDIPRIGRGESIELTYKVKLLSESPVTFCQEQACIDCNGYLHSVPCQQPSTVQVTPAAITPPIQPPGPAMCPGAGTLDVVFAMDTSGSMDDEFSALCTQIEAIVAGLRNRGVVVDHRILGIARSRDCATDNVANLYPGQVDDEEDWGPAVMDLAYNYPWQPGRTRLIVPMADEGPDDGEPVADPGSDRDAVQRAIAAAQANNVIVSPVLGTGYNEAILRLAQDLARGTNGGVFLTTAPASDLADGISRLLGGAACTPFIQDIQPSCEITETTTVTITGANFMEAVAVEVAGQPARDVVRVSDRQIHIRIPRGLAEGFHDVTVINVAGGWRYTRSGALIIGPCGMPTPTPPQAAPAIPEAQTPPVRPTPAPTPLINLPSAPLGCAAWYWQLLPWLLMLLALLLWWLLLGRPRWGDIRSRWEGKEWRCRIPCLLLFLYTLWFAWLIGRALASGLCRPSEAIYFWRMDGRDFGIYVTSLDNRDGPQPFTPANRAGCVGCHSVSTAGNRLATAGSPVPGKLAIIQLTGEDVPSPAVDVMYVAWSPDGKHLAYASPEGDIVILDVDRGTTSPLTGASEMGILETMPAWSPDGNTIAFVRTTSLLYGLVVDAPSDINTVPANGGQAQPLPGASGGAFNYYPAYSPDGKWLSFTRHTTGQSSYADPAAEIYIVPATGGTAVRISANDAADGSPLQNVSNSWPTWSRDGRWLTFNSKRNDPAYDIFLAEIDAQGNSGPAMPLPGAAESGLFEHLPYWGPPPELVPWWQRLLNLWPWLIPLLVLWFLCRWLCRRRKEVEAVIPPPAPIPARRTWTPPEPLGRWVGPPPVWDPEPTLVIGLGGTGRWVLTLLKKNLLDAGAGRISNKVRLLLLDTSEAELLDGQQLPVRFAGVELSPEETLVLGEDLSKLVRQMAEDPEVEPEMQSWFPAQVYTRRVADAELDLVQGTHRRRPLGRAAIFRQARQGRQGALWQQLLKGAAAVQEGERVRIMIVGSLTGGLGSAAFFDAAYLARRAAWTIGAKAATVEGFLATQHTFDRVVTAPRGLAVNTFAALREMQRFQLAQGRPYPMPYDRSEAGDEVLNGRMDWRLLDDCTLFDAQRPYRPLTLELPGNGVFASMADAITLHLDRASRVGTDSVLAYRRTARQLTDGEQRRTAQAVVSSLGTFAYRLPVYDLVEALKVRWAKHLLHFFLMGEAGGEVRFDPALNREDLAGRMDELVYQYMRGVAGLGAMPPVPRFLFSLLKEEQGWSAGRASELRGLSVRSLEEERQSYRTYLLEGAIRLLNGSVETELVRARCGKVGYVLRFLERVERLWIDVDGEVQLLGPKVGANLAPQVDSLRPLPAAYREETAAVRRRLQAQAEMLSDRAREVAEEGWRAAARGPQGVYERLAAWEEELNRRREQMWAVKVRRYFMERELLDRWYQEYLVEKVGTHLGRLYWQVDPEGKGMDLTLYGLGEKPIRASEEGAVGFGRALLDLADYLASPIWEGETLAQYLSQAELKEDRLPSTAQEMWEWSSPLLDFDRAAAPDVQTRVVLGANRTVEEAPTLANELARKLPSARQMMNLPLTDPYTMLLAQMVDVIPAGASIPYRDAEKYYCIEHGLTPETVGRGVQAEPDAIFAAERNALVYEQRVPELEQMPRLFHPLLVAGLEDLRRARLFAQAYAAGFVIRRHAAEGEIYVVRLPGQEDRPLTTPEDLKDALALPVVALLRFGLELPEAVVEDVESALRALSAEEKRARWRAFEELVLPELTSKGAKREAQDLAAFISLVFRDEERRLRGG